MLGLVLLIDESGSMSSLETDVIKTINEFIDNQKKELILEDVKVTIATFNIHRKFLCKNEPLSTVKEFSSFIPRGPTALYDAICRTIRDVKKYDYSKVIFCIFTDGVENASIVFTKADIQSIINDCKDENWNFIYICTSIDSFQKESLVYQGQELGITEGGYIDYKSIQSQFSQQINSSFATYYEQNIL